MCGIAHLLVRCPFESGAEGAQSGSERGQIAHAHCTTLSRHGSMLCLHSKGIGVLKGQECVQAWGLQMCTVQSKC